MPSAWFSADCRRAHRRQEAAASQRIADLSGQLIRSAALDPRAGSLPVPQIELSEVSGEQVAIESRSAARRAAGDGSDREVLRRGRNDEEPDRAGQLAFGGFDRQAARRPGGQFLRVGQRRQYVADPAVEKFDFARGTSSARTPVGRHEELCPDDSGRIKASRPLPDQHQRDVLSDRGLAIRPIRPGSAQTLRESQIGKILERLDEREQKIIISRFGLARARTSDLERGWGGDGGDQGADSSDRSPALDKLRGPPKKRTSRSPAFEPVRTRASRNSSRESGYFGRIATFLNTALGGFSDGVFLAAARQRIQLRKEGRRQPRRDKVTRGLPPPRR